MARKQKKAQTKLLNEIKTQLILQAERWGRTDFYTPLKLEELELDQCLKIRGDLLAEKSNLEYELHSLGTDKKEVLIKLERLNLYLRRADYVIRKHAKNINKIIDKTLEGSDVINRALRGLRPMSTVSVMMEN